MSAQEGRLKRKRKTESTEESKPKKPKTVNCSDSAKTRQTKNVVATQKHQTDTSPQWTEWELLAEQQSIDLEIAKNIINLFEDGNTIPFIARYRKNITNNMTPEALREVKATYDEIVTLKSKIDSAIKKLEKSASLTDELKQKISRSRSIEELEYVYAPYKPAAKRTLAERAKELGLEAPALDIFFNRKIVDLTKYVQTTKKELSSVTLVENGVIHIIASFIAVDSDILSNLREMRKKNNIIIKTSKTKKASSKVETKHESNAETTKFQHYEDFEIPVKYIKPHQILAINRGEHLKVLTVKVIVPDSIFNQFKKQCFAKWMRIGSSNQFRENIINKAIEDSYTRLVQPLIIREIRSELKQQADKASCEVFSTNLKHLLLTTPVKGKYILGIDPGFSNGCKLAMISPMGELVIHNIIYPHKSKNKEKDMNVLKHMLSEHNCELIALGNGTACRLVEEWLTNLIQEKVFYPLDVQYTIVREEGASIYSCSPEAKKEFPELDPNIISAVSMARRVQNPLAELVKVEPKHLGIGMYQHDIKKKQLEEALDDVVSECVSFVGVDLNTASLSLLKHVAGLSEKKAQQIIEYRTKTGPFISRKQILDVHGIGQRIFQQCAGFLRVGPLGAKDATNFYKNSKTTKLDCTYIHPESYDIAKNLIKKMNLSLKDVGEVSFVNSVKLAKLDLVKLGEELKSNEHTLQLILEALLKPLNYDLRNECKQEQFFKKGVTQLDDLRSGIVLTGRVNNVTHFGCFVDIGVGVNGLIHVSKYGGFVLNVGTKVEVKVLNVEIGRKRISLEAIKTLQ